MNHAAKRDRRKRATKVPTRVFHVVGDRVYGPDEFFPYIIKDAGRLLSAFFGKELLHRFSAKQARGLKTEG